MFSEFCATGAIYKMRVVEYIEYMHESHGMLDQLSFLNYF